MITNKAIVEAVTQMYFDPRNGKVKRRIARNSPGGIRRFVAVINQFDCTYDLYSIGIAEIMVLLPEEFAKFKSGWQTELFRPSGKIPN